MVQQSIDSAFNLMGLGSVGCFVLTMLLTIQRCHDMDWTGWASLLTMIPLVGLLFWFVPGTPGPNRFGAPPPPNGTGIKVLAWAGVLTLVLGIVGVLAALSLPAYEDYQQRARAAQVR
jgi:formate hydrogenlyase subunit 3/multisubunit Na+/H+ antiporter MnhD subunit